LKLMREKQLDLSLTIVRLSLIDHCAKMISLKDVVASMDASNKAIRNSPKSSGKATSLGPFLYKMQITKQTIVAEKSM